MKLPSSTSMHWVILLFIFGATTACIDDSADPPSNDPDFSLSEEFNSEAQSPEDCAEEEEFNPSTSRCYLPESGNDGNQNNDETCPDGTSGPDCDDDSNQDERECGDGFEFDEELDHCAPLQPCATSTLVGRACRPYGRFLPNQEVQLSGVDCHGEPFEVTTVSDQGGFYEFSGVPAGTHELFAEFGPFELEEELTLPEGSTLNITGPQNLRCFEAPEVSVLVLQGAYDDISGLISMLGIPHTVESVNKSALSHFFANSENLSAHDVLVFESSSLPASIDFEFDEPAASNIRDFVASGGTIIASDWADSLFYNTFPDAMSFKPREDPFAFWAGKSDEYTATILDPVLEDMLRSSTITINPPGGWRVIDQLGSTTQALFAGDVEVFDTDSEIVTLHDFPLLSVYEYVDYVINSDGGRIYYTPAQFEKQSEEKMLNLLTYMILADL